jgi:Excalibur calcium-binding domain
MKRMLSIMTVLFLLITCLSSVDAKPKPKPKPKPKIEYFRSCAALRVKYPHGVPKGHPAYRRALDRDHDNWACEDTAAR